MCVIIFAMQRKISFASGEYYHIYNRGTDKRVIYMEPHDYRRFIALLYICNNTDPVDINEHFREGKSFIEILSLKRSSTLVDIGAYCLMPNHFHLLIRERSDGGITKFMSKLLTAYSMYFNSKNSRTGCLFEGRFKASHADTDEYLKYLFAYIHLNPIKIIDPKWKENGIANRQEASKYLFDYTHSSYQDYMLIKRKESSVLNKGAFPLYFSSLSDFERSTNEWLTYKDILI